MEYQTESSIFFDHFSDSPPANMTRWLTMVAAIWVSNATAQLGKAFTGISGAITKEVAAIKDPIDKTAVFVGFSQCSNVKKIIGVDYDSYEGKEPDMSKLSLDFITPEVRIQYNLTTLTELPRMPKFNPAKGLVIYLHGFTDDPTKDSFTDIDKAFMKQGNFNILALDASSLIQWFYLRASTMVRFIGQALGTALALMVKAGLNPADIHLIGHSLGSHIASFTGKTFYTITGQRVGRLTGLDPAGPCFADVEAGLKLNRTDAEFVDVIHSDAGVYGLNEQVGDVDFYPNSGSEQPNCLFQTCSHSRAWEMFSESVANPEGFPAVKCESWKDYKKRNCDYDDVRLMGYAASPGGPLGRYYLQTADKSPFALGRAGLNFTNTDGIVRSIRDEVNLWK